MANDVVDPDVLRRLRRAICARLPDAEEQRAWVGTRWRIRSKTFAHVLVVVDGRPQSYATAARADGPLTMMTFTAPPEDLHAFAKMGPPYLRMTWGREVAGLIIAATTDWDELEEFVVESYCIHAPKRLAARVRDLA